MKNYENSLVKVCLPFCRRMRVPMRRILCPPEVSQRFGTRFVLLSFRMWSTFGSLLCLHILRVDQNIPLIDHMPHTILPTLTLLQQEQPPIKMQKYKMKMSQLL